MSCVIRQMTAEDIAPALQLCRQAGWNQTRADWQRLLSYQPQGCFAAEQEGRLAGTVTTTSYGKALAWIGMMLVSPECRRQGIATALMQRSIEFLKERGTRRIKLDATPEGAFVYSRLGFVPEAKLHRWCRDEASEPCLFEPNAPTCLDPFASTDQEAFGADRRDWLQRVSVDSRTLVSEDGFGMIRAGHLANYLGPIVCRNQSNATEIVTHLIEDVSGRLFWDVPHGDGPAVELAKLHQFRPIRDLLRMRLGPPDAPRLEWQYAICEPGTG